MIFHNSANGKTAARPAFSLPDKSFFGGAFTFVHQDKPLV